MGSRWAVAFAAATLISLFGTATLRRVALSAGIVDRPGSHKSHAREVPYLGGIAIAAAALVGWLASPGIRGQLAVILLAGVVLALVGLLDDDRMLQLGPRIVVQLAAAGAALAVGVRADVTGIPAVDVVITLLWIVGITNALNLLDNMDGLAGGISVATGVGVFALAALDGQEVVAVGAAALVGACLGFLAYNTRPASIFMGDAGALFLGYVLSVAALELDLAIGPPGSFLVPLVLLGLAILDTTVVVLGRLRHGRAVGRGGRDHLSHRLVALGLSPGAAVGVLVVVQFGLSAIAVFVGRGVVGVPAGAAAAGLALVVVALVATRGRVYEEPTLGFSRRFKLIASVAVLGVLALATPAVLATADARQMVEDAHGASDAALSAARAGDSDAAEAALDDAEASFEEAQRRLEQPLAAAGLVVPVVGPNVRASRELSAAGIELSNAARASLHAVDSERLRVVDATVPVDEIERIAPDLERVATMLDDASSRIDGIERRFVVDPIDETIEEVEDELDEARHDANRAAVAARRLPAVLGAEGTRSYFLAVQDSAELRATGGVIGSWGILTADRGELDLTPLEGVAVLNEAASSPSALDAPDDFVRRYARFDPATTWQNVNMSPDFPTVASVIADRYPQSGGAPIDGVIALDPQGLAALLELTGPVDVEGWPEPVTADNVVEVTLRDRYTVLEDPEEGADLLGEVTEAVWEAAAGMDLGTPDEIADALAEAARQGHLMVSFLRPEEQELAEELEIAGDVPASRSDSLLLVTQNAAGNKADVFLRRSIDYAVRIDPDDDGTEARVRGRLTASLENGAPASGLPSLVIGPYDEEDGAGANRSFVSLYTPLSFTAASLDGRPTSLEATTELGRHVYSRFVDTPSGATSTLELELDGPVRLGAGHWYALDLVRQPGRWPDAVSVEIAAGPGWRIAETVGLETEGGVARGTTELDGSTTVWIRLEPGGRSFWERLSER